MERFKFPAHQAQSSFPIPKAMQSAKCLAVAAFVFAGVLSSNGGVADAQDAASSNKVEKTNTFTAAESSSGTLLPSSAGTTAAIQQKSRNVNSVFGSVGGKREGYDDSDDYDDSSDSDDYGYGGYGKSNCGYNAYNNYGGYGNAYNGDYYGNPGYGNGYSGYGPVGFNSFGFGNGFAPGYLFANGNFL